MKDTTGFNMPEACSAVANFHRVADFADQYHRTGRRILVEGLQRVAGRGANHRIANDAEEGRLADPSPGQVEADKRAEAAAARDYTELARLEDVRVIPRRDADEALARSDYACGVRPDDAGMVRRSRVINRDDVPDGIFASGLTPIIATTLLQYSGADKPSIICTYCAFASLVREASAM